MGFGVAQACPPLALSPVCGPGVCLPTLRHRGATSNVTETPLPPNLTSLPPRQERRENHGVRGSPLSLAHTPRWGRPSSELNPGRWARGRTTYKPSAQDPAWSADVLDHSGPPTAKTKQRGALTPEPGSQRALCPAPPCVAEAERTETLPEERTPVQGSFSSHHLTPCSSALSVTLNWLYEAPGHLWPLKTT